MAAIDQVNKMSIPYGQIIEQTYREDLISKPYLHGAVGAIGSDGLVTEYRADGWITTRHPTRAELKPDPLIGNNFDRQREQPPLSLWQKFWRRIWMGD